MELQHALRFTYSTVQRNIVCHPDAISHIESTLDELGVVTAMIVCGPTILRHANVVQRVQQALGDRCVGLFAGVIPHAPVEMLQEAVDAAFACQPEALVSVGGGSSHDTAKGMAAGLEWIATATLHDRGLATNPKPIHDVTPILQVLRNAW
jgi:alcohol dehydrogenase class IV